MRPRHAIAWRGLGATGDLTDNGRPEQYDLLVEILDRCELPLLVIPGNHDERVAWLDATLATQPDAPTVVFMHHPPFTTGIWWMDCIGLTGAAAFETVVRRHPQVRVVLCGHLHRPIQTSWGPTLVSTAPRTTHQTQCNLHPDHSPVVAAEVPMLQLHWWTGTSFVSHTTPFETPANRIDIGAMVADWPSAQARIKQGPPFANGGVFG